jgi:hypothetical protein
MNCDLFGCQIPLSFLLCPWSSFQIFLHIVPVGHHLGILELHWVSSSNVRLLPSVTYCTYPVPVLRIRYVYPGSRILIFTHPGSWISDPGSKNSNKREGEKNVVIPFYVVTNITKLKIILVLKC